MDGDGDPANAVAVVILTRNEEPNLSYALDSVATFAAEVFVVDSFSSDRTVEIAKERGCSVVSRTFVNQAEQFNWALDKLPIKSDWILRLDADEYVSPELAVEIAAAVSNAPADVAGFYMRRRMVFMGRWIRYGGYYPIWLLRLFRRGYARSEAVEMDEHIVLSIGCAARLQSDFVDHNRKGLREWLRKHEAYAARQARVLINRLATEPQEAVRPRFFGTQVERKRWLKHNVYGRCPLFVRPPVYFIYRYFLRCGFMDGLEGLIFHFLHAGWYMFYIDAIIWESKAAAREPH